MKLALSLLAAPAIAFTAPQTTPTRAATQLFAYMQRAGGAWDGSDLKGAALRRAKKKQSQGMYTAGKWLDSDREYEENGPGVMSFFTQFNGGKQEKVEDRARQNGISQDAQLWRDAGALSAKQASKIKASKLASRRRSSACSRSPCLYPVV